MKTKQYFLLQDNVINKQRKGRIFKDNTEGMSSVIILKVNKAFIRGNLLAVAAREKKRKTTN